MRSLAIGLLLLPGLISAAEAGPKLTLTQVTERALANPRAQAADSDTAGAQARLDEADAARLPRGKLTAFGTISPEIHCVNVPIPNTATVINCASTEPTIFAFNFSGLYGSAQLDITQPLYTFGKIAHARSAARAGSRPASAAGRSSPWPGQPTAE